MSDAPLGVTRDDWLALVYWGGLSAYCTGYATCDDGTVYLSLIGRVTAVKAVWAAFMDHQALELPDRTLLRRRPTDEETTYQTLRARLPETGWGHTVVIHSQATQANLPEWPFYVLSATPQPPLSRFWAQWNRCLAYPSQPDWATYLWRAGTRHELITPCASQGTHAWRVRPGDRWADLITWGVEDGEIDA